MKKLLLLLGLTAGYFTAEAQNQYLITFKDKGPEAAFFRQHPEKILSDKSLARRQKHGINLKEEDLPVSQTYINQLQKNGIRIEQKSKWLNAVHVETSLDPQTLKLRVPAIKELKIYTTSNVKAAPDKFPESAKNNNNNRLNYGITAQQIDQLNLDCLHDKGFQGKGVWVAVFDTGFPGVNTLAAYDSLRQQNRILTTRNFVSKPTTVYGTHDHGELVFSTMAVNLPGTFVGAAARATYALAITEYIPTETHQEELNWAAAAEWADSLGADIIQSSLSYRYFDTGQGDYTDADLDGNTAIITKAADKAAQKGILVVNSAGNNGNLTFPLSPKIAPPADGDSVMCVGSVTNSNQYSSFSSIGPTADNRIKPDVVAQGSGTSIILPNGIVGATNGTSLSTPLISSLAACLMQANRGATNMQVFQAIKQSADKSQNPNNLFGWGLPDACKADSLLKTVLGSPEKLTQNQVKVYPSFFQDNITIEAPANSEILSVALYSITGQKISDQSISISGKYLLPVERNLPAGLYFLRLQQKNGTYLQFKIVKQN